MLEDLIRRENDVGGCLALRVLTRICFFFLCFYGYKLQPVSIILLSLSLAFVLFLIELSEGSVFFSFSEFYLLEN